MTKRTAALALLVPALFLIVGYGLGKHAADNWYNSRFCLLTHEACNAFLHGTELPQEKVWDPGPEMTCKDNPEQQRIDCTLPYPETKKDSTGLVCNEGKQIFTVYDPRTGDHVDKCFSTIPYR